MSPKLHQFAVTLQRDGLNTPWGIRLVGGNDLDTPLIITRVQLGTPADGEVLRGDIISKIGEYDARDLSHADAQQLFRTAGNEIHLVVLRDSKIAYTQGLSNENSRCNSAASLNPEILNQNNPHRGPSPFLPGPGQYDRALQMPVDTLPQTVFPKLNASGGYVAPVANSSFMPMPTRDHQQEVSEEQAAIINQPYRTTPLVLPGAKVKKDAPSTESYLRHYPNPAVRAHPGHDYHDSIMKQRVADTMLHKVVGPDADSGKVFHKQFNSPIGLYSDSNIETAIRQTVPSAGQQPSNIVRVSPLHRPLPTKLDGYKKTVLYDPSKSETFRAIQEEGYGYSDTTPREVTIPVQTKVYQPNRLVPGKKSQSTSVPGPSYNVVNSHDDTIRQSGSFNRLMYSVLGATDY